ncbi:alpha-mannosidase [Picrophilus oshimae]|uniref:Alpha-mannosidase n=1 Tax=Picrophilus torridus (strain ATCC 700027 / DSM 9790 / JCM 10055 / NBRC 100828 / KAW 2/3) TaxID=1122961 RepID=Q6L2X5_PICTO|nr:glycosyl hydrolase-related protein [Picrophilus oshimae]AAT42676.1 alpha-mannosidase [Picrophilus oshimae DSM 9789]
MVNIKRKLDDIIALSFNYIKSINKVEINGNYVDIPLKLNVQPDTEITMKFSLELKNSNKSLKNFIVFLTSGTGIVYINDREEQALDSGHRLIIFDTNDNNLEIKIRINPRGLFGSNQWNFSINEIYYGKINFDDYSYGIYLKNIYELIEKYYPEINGEIKKVIINFPYTPNVKQISCIEAISDEKYKEYEEISDFYSYPVFNGMISDLNANKYDLNPLKEKIKDIIKNINKKDTKDILAIGHCHIDVAWLWPYSETRKKVYKSFLNVLKLNKKYEFTFAQSTSLFYEWIEDTDIFNDIKNMIKMKKWIPVGGMYVESDTNLLSGEALARQFLYGQRYFIEKFGFKCNIGWLPDSFGFSFQLPQILKNAGINIFITHKMKWNDVNDFPYDVFIWKGLDGTEINVSLINLTYNGSMKYKEIMDGWKLFKNKDKSMIYLYGYGDGGGGPTQEMLELMNYANKYKIFNINKNPNIADIENIFHGHLPVYNDELYLEYHRGVYTTNSHIKNYIASLSQELIIYDFLNAFNLLYNNKDNSESLIKSWKALLKSQFHDVLPGSANYYAYLEAFNELKDAENRIKNIINGNNKYLFNFTQFKYSGFVEINNNVFNINIKPYSIIKLEEHKNEKHNIYLEKHDDYYIIKNRYFDLKINNDGTFSLSKNGELLIKNGNMIRVINDVPEKFDAWNIDYNDLKEPSLVHPKCVKIEVKNTDNFIIINITRSFLNESYVINEITIGNSDDIKIKNKIYMEAREKLIKSCYEFPDYVKSVKCGIPFGSITRNETKERFEFPVLDWINCPENSGIYFTSKTIHGYSLIDGILGISLARYPIYPDPFTETIVENEYYIHVGNDNPYMIVAKTIKKPMLIDFNPDKIPLNEQLIDIKPDNVIIEALKVSEDKNGIIIRLFESKGIETKVDLKMNYKFKIYESDLTELNKKPLESISMRPFEIKTLFLEF